ncbi:MAG: 16S rRNA (guanine(527)-N(7))-methyltransferase RsmG [Bacteroidales bacterium]
MDEIITYFPELSKHQIENLSRLWPLYKQWNACINVISRKDIDNLCVNHVLHSLSIAKLISFEKGTRILDVGTGGGFPGIPLAIFFPEVSFHLVDSVGKKIKVVREIVKALDLQNVSYAQQRAEDSKTSYDFILSRAVTTLPVFYQWVHHKVGKHSRNALQNGLFYLKGGDIAEEIASLYPQKVYIYPIELWFNESYFKEKKIVYMPV